jgi:hypothetical protein
VVSVAPESVRAKEISVSPRAEGKPTVRGTSLDVCRATPVRSLCPLCRPGHSIAASSVLRQDTLWRCQLHTCRAHSRKQTGTDPGHRPTRPARYRALRPPSHHPSPNSSTKHGLYNGSRCRWDPAEVGTMSENPTSIASALSISHQCSRDTVRI